MRNPAILTITLLMFSCSDVPDTKILCECYSERQQRTYEDAEGKYFQEPSCLSEMSGLINENDKKFQMKKNGWIFNFSRGRNESDFYVDWQDSKIIASGEDMNFDKVFFTLDRVNLKSYLLTRVLFYKPTDMGTTGVNIEQNYQCKVVEGV
ncbi:hypothetical protein N9N74_05450 [Gammaproteobacteria bacterium]|nr:hypothetical protein [Gammaproteobacteria bacterium]